MCCQPFAADSSTGVPTAVPSALYSCTLTEATGISAAARACPASFCHFLATTIVALVSGISVALFVTITFAFAEEAIFADLSAEAAPPSTVYEVVNTNPAFVTAVSFT